MLEITVLYFAAVQWRRRFAENFSFCEYCIVVVTRTIKYFPKQIGNYVGASLTQMIVVIVDRPFIFRAVASPVVTKVWQGIE